MEKYVGIEAPPQDHKTVLRSIIGGEGWFTGDEIAEKSELWAKTFYKMILSFLNDSFNRGSFHVFSLNSKNNEYIQGSCYCEPNDSLTVRDAKARRSNTLLLYRAIREKSASDLETICVRLLTLLGVKEPHHTPRSGDGGVDFYGATDFGFILKPEVLPAGSERHMKVWFVGQAKHYPNASISTAEIREIVGSSYLARSKLFAGKTDPLSKFDARLCDPIFSIFITTGRFSKDCVELMERAGIIPMDGPQLGQFLADHGVGLVDKSFSIQAFEAWVEGAIS